MENGGNLVIQEEIHVGDAAAVKEWIMDVDPHRTELTFDSKPFFF